MCRVLCHSEGKARKEKAISDKKGNPFIDDIENFRKSILKGSIKKPDKIADKLQRIIRKHRSLSKNYEVTLDTTDGKITGISLTKTVVEEAPLYG